MKTALVILVCLFPAAALRCELGLSTKANSGTLGNITCPDNNQVCFSAQCTYGNIEPYNTASLKGCGGALTCWQMNFACKELHGSSLRSVSCKECDTDYCNL
uniref:Uncharacterized protein n=1 Tax=Plectus sambesii TaxID=2011161 RepID=A0A914USH5_9BILA